MYGEDNKSKGLDLEEIEYEDFPEEMDEEDLEDIEYDDFEEETEYDEIEIEEFESEEDNDGELQDKDSS